MEISGGNMEKQITVTPLVSVLVVTYNQEQFIRKVIEGALMQKTNFPFEIVIGDDASTDRTIAICGEFCRIYPDTIKLLPSSSNLGLNRNFLRTFRQCRGKYIAYLEGDDWWITDDKLQKQVDILESEPDVVFVHTNCKLFDVSTKTLSERLISYKGACVREQRSGIEGVIAEFEGRFRPVKTSTACYCRQTMADILEADEFLFSNPDFPTQDFQLFQEMCLRGRFAFIDEDTTVIAYHDSISAANDPVKRLKFRYGFFQIGLYLIDKYQLPKKAVRIWIRKELYFFFKDAIERRDRSYLMKVIPESEKRGYRLPLTQLLKLFFVRCIT